MRASEPRRRDDGMGTDDRMLVRDGGARGVWGAGPPMIPSRCLPCAGTGGAGAFPSAPGGDGGGTVQRPFEYGAAPMGERNVPGNPARGRGNLRQRVDRSADGCVDWRTAPDLLY